MKEYQNPTGHRAARPRQRGQGTACQPGGNRREQNGAERQSWETADHGVSDDPGHNLLKGNLLLEDHFGKAVAEDYDESVAEMFDPSVIEATVSFLAELAGDGPILELGVGTGRLALPLSQQGLQVHGIDLSAPMLSKLKAKPGGDAVAVTQGDFATTTLNERFSLVYLVFNTVMNLTSQEAQGACFQNAAHHLRRGGRFVIEVTLPRIQRLPPGETLVPFLATPTRLGFDEYDVVSQSLVSHHYSLRDGRLQARSIPFRYVWPSELDLMARMAGMSLVERWADWDRSPFTANSQRHVSVWELAGGD